jgi:threonine dehydratase
MTANTFPVAEPTIDEIVAARARIEHTAVRTPLVRLRDAGGPPELYVKLENLQPIGSFKIRGAANATSLASPAALARGAYTASAGNMAQGVAWCARERGIPCTVVVPERAPQTKIDAIERLGGAVLRVPFDEWWRAMVEHAHPGATGVFVHPFEDTAVMAGNGTIGLEIVEDLANVDAVLVPWGGGGLACGIAAAMRAVSPRTRVYPVEVDTAAPLSASWREGKPAEVTPTPSFVDGIGGKSVFPRMWPLAQALLEPPIVVSVRQIEAAIRLLAERTRVIAEGAGAAPVAAALARAPAGARRVVCIVSGGNIELARLAAIIAPNGGKQYE